MSLSTKPEVNNIATLPEEDRATSIGNIHKNLVKIGRVILELSERSDRQTNRQAVKLITL